MRMKSILPFFLVLLNCTFLSVAFAAVNSFDGPEECTYVRLDEKDGPYAKLPVYNQALGTKSDPNICYAITASLLIDAYRIRHGDHSGTLSSPISLALSSRLTDSASPMIERSSDYDDTDPVTYLVGGGSIFSALKASQGSKVCDQSWLNKDVPLISDSSGAYPLDQFLNLLTQKSPFAPPSPALICTAIAELNKQCEGHFLKLNVPDPKEYEFGAKDSAQAQAELVKRLQDPSLTKEERKVLATEYLQRFGLESKIANYGKIINDLLNDPMSSGVGIGYLYSALTNNTGGHASVVIGRRYNQNEKKCELLVRDSYGSSCTDLNGNPRYQLPCENGSVWVEAGRLLKDTVNLTWIPSN